MPNPDQHKKAALFQALHEGEPFVIPNPWDGGSAKVLAGLGFKALATTSSGFAFTLGRPDGGVTLAQVVDHARLLDGATELPLTVDLENGFGSGPREVGSAIGQIAAAGAVGASIEDYDHEDGIYPIEQAVERVAGAVEAAHRLDFPFTLTARAENHVRGNPDLEDTIARLRAYERVGADVLFAPGLRSTEQVQAVAAALQRPLNVLAIPNLSIEEIIGAGAQRISLGGRLAWTAVDAMVEAARQIRDRGNFSTLSDPSRVVEWLASADGNTISP
ncbi:MAG: isocitrate lyase/phosphoenolpyruvate mutase family protein [Solirubrobacterales bacterium]